MRKSAEKSSKVAREMTAGSRNLEASGDFKESFLFGGQKHVLDE